MKEFKTLKDFVIYCKEDNVAYMLWIGNDAVLDDYRRPTPFIFDLVTGWDYRGNDLKAALDTLEYLKKWDEDFARSSTYSLYAVTLNDKDAPAHAELSPDDYEYQDINDLILDVQLAFAATH